MIIQTTTMSTTSYNHTDVVNTTVTIPTTPDMTSTISLTTLASVTNTEPIPFYAIGILAVLVLFVGGACMFGSIDFLLHLKLKNVNFGSLQQSIDQHF